MEKLHDMTTGSIGNKKAIAIEIFLGVENLLLGFGIDRINMALSNCQPSVENEIRDRADSRPEKKDLPKKDKIDPKTGKRRFQKYRFIYDFTIQGKRVKVLLNRSGSEIYMSLFEPGIAVQHLLNSVFIKHGIIPNIHCVEFAWDFYHQSHEVLMQLQKLIAKHALHLHQYKKSWTFPEIIIDSYTWYSSDSHGAYFLKLYLRGPDGGFKFIKGIETGMEFLRLELTLNNSFLRLRPLPFPIDPDVIRNMNPLGLFRMSEFDRKGFRKFLCKSKMRSDPRRKAIEAGMTEPDPEKPITITASKFCDKFDSYTLMQIIDRLKRIKGMQYDRFLIPLPVENAILMNAIDTMHDVVLLTDLPKQG